MLTPGQMLGSYRIVRQIGKGGMGAVFEGVHEHIERHVAIKVLHPQYSQEPQIARRFFNEARAVNIVDHPGIVQISDFGQLGDGTAYLVMELLKGESMGARLGRLGRLDLPEALLLTRQIAGALQAAHDKTIVHRDLKPDNVMIVPDPEAPSGERAKLLDFGIAKVVAECQIGEAGPERLTQTGMMMGTAVYMAPEQCRGAGQVDSKADVYSLGVIVFQMLSGTLPFIADGLGAIMAMHIYEPPPPLRRAAPTVSAEVEALVLSMMAKDPALRPTMGQVAESCAALGGGASSMPPRQGTVAMPQQPPTPSIATLSKANGQAEAPPSSSRRTWLVGAGAGILALGASLFVLIQQSPRRGEPHGLTASAPRVVRWQIHTAPPGASVLQADGQLLGQTPWYIERQAAAGLLQVTLRQAGYADRTLLLDQGKDEDRREGLQAVVAKESIAAAPAPQSAGKDKTKERDKVRSGRPRPRPRGLSDDDVPLPDL